MASVQAIDAFIKTIVKTGKCRFLLLPNFNFLYFSTLRYVVQAARVPSVPIAVSV